MAGTSRRKLSAQFKAEAVQLVIQSDRTIAQVAGEVGIDAGTVSHLAQMYRKGMPEPEKELSPADCVRLAPLEEDNRRLRFEDVFLNYDDVRVMPMSAGRCWWGGDRVTWGG